MDPFPGLHYTCMISDYWRLCLRGDHGYYDSDNTNWMAEALADWRFNDWVALSPGIGVGANAPFAAVSGQHIAADKLLHDFAGATVDTLYPGIDEGA